MSPALAGGFLTTVPPEKSQELIAFYSTIVEGLLDAGDTVS